MLVVFYLVAIVAANLSVAYFGPVSAVVNAFLFIGLDITARDGLHERWQGKNLWVKMTILIGVGSLLSWLLNRNAGPIALASFVAFAAAGLADTLVYLVMHRFSRMYKVNGSNVVSAAVDSIVFPTLAFGALMPMIVLGQFVAKVAGGYLWSILLNKWLWQRTSTPAQS